MKLTNTEMVLCSWQKFDRTVDEPLCFPGTRATRKNQRGNFEWDQLTTAILGDAAMKYSTKSNIIEAGQVFGDKGFYRFSPVSLQSRVMLRSFLKRQVDLILIVGAFHSRS